MVRVASAPPKFHMFRVKKLTDFWTVVKLVIQQVNPREFNTKSQTANMILLANCFSVENVLV